MTRLTKGGLANKVIKPFTQGPKILSNTFNSIKNTSSQLMNNRFSGVNKLMHAAGAKLTNWKNINQMGFGSNIKSPMPRMKFDLAGKKASFGQALLGIKKNIGKISTAPLFTKVKSSLGDMKNIVSQGTRSLMTPTAGKLALSTGIDMIPGVGNVKSGLEALTGRDYITGAKLSKTDRLIAAAGIVSGGQGKVLLKSLNGLRKVKVTSNLIQGTSKADNIAKYNLLKKDLKYTERYGPEARKELSDGRIRYYSQLEPARKRGEMAGRRVVQELNPSTGKVRTWHETLDTHGRIRQVRPQLGPNKTHYRFNETGNYIGKW